MSITPKIAFKTALLVALFFLPVAVSGLSQGEFDGTRTGPGYPQECPAEPEGGPETRDGQETFNIPLEELRSDRVCFNASNGMYLDYSSDTLRVKENKDYVNISVGYSYYMDEYPSNNGWYATITYLQIDSESTGHLLPSYSKGVVKVELILSPTSNSSVGEVGVFRATSPIDANDIVFVCPKYDGKYPENVDISKSYGIQTPSKKGEFYRWDITELVAAWSNGTPNHGICLLPLDVPERDDPAPVGSEPRAVSVNLNNKIVDEENGIVSGTLLVTHNVNEAPVATIATIEPADPVPGQTVYLNGTVTDPDGDDIKKYKWWTPDGLLDEGPAADRITAVFSEGAYAIYFSALDDDPGYSRWSTPDKHVLIVEVSANQAPLVTSAQCLVNGVPSSTVAEDEMVEFMIAERWERTGLQGTISIMGTAIVVNQEVMTDNGDGTYSYFWSTSGMKPGTYSVDFTLADPVSGLVDPDGFLIGLDLTLTIMDTTPPFLEQLKVISGMENDVVQPGDMVTIQAVEASGESGLDAHITIEGTTQTIEDVLMDRGFGIYEYRWDTLGYKVGKYSVNVVLEDDFGNRDENGIDDKDPDLEISIMDTVPPEVMSVLYFSRDDEGIILVQVTNQEEGLDGTVYVDGPESLELDLVDDGEGHYTASLDLAGMEPGQYGVEVVVWDSNGNFDQDGLLKEPDTEFLLVEPNDPPVIENWYPMNGAVMEPVSFQVEATFSEEVFFSDSLEWALRVWKGDGNTIQGTVTLTNDGTTLRFHPDAPWSLGDYTVSVSDKLKDTGDMEVTGELVWRFTVRGSVEPVGLLESEPETDPQIEPGDSIEFNVSFSNAERTEWWVNGILKGEGDNFTLETSQSGIFGVAAVGVSGDQKVVKEWKVTVAPAPDTSDGDDTEGTDVEDDSGSNTLAGGVLGAMGAVMIVIALLLYLRPGKEGKPQQGTQAAGGRDAAKVTTPQAPSKGPAPVVRKEAPRDGRSPPPGNSAAGRPGQAKTNSVVKKVQ